MDEQTRLFADASAFDAPLQMRGFSDADSKRGALLAPRRHATHTASQPKSYTDDVTSFNRLTYRSTSHVRAMRILRGRSNATLSADRTKYRRTAPSVRAVANASIA
ncbi:MAG: hypothetical protein ACN6QC_13855, partial [Paraburkholderia hospita]